MRHPTNKEFTVLRLLAANPAGLYGLQLVEQSDGEISRGSVYFILDRLEEEGWVKARTEAPPPGYGGKPRQIFQIEALGRRVFDHEALFAGLASGQAVPT